MRLIIVRHGETDWTLSGRYTGTTDVDLTANGHREATESAPLLTRVLHGPSCAAVSSPRHRATGTAARALPERHPSSDPLVAQHDYGDYEGLTTDQIRVTASGWNISRDGWPHGESTADIGTRADAFSPRARREQPQPVVVTHGHFSRIPAARALGLAAFDGLLFANAPRIGLGDRGPPRRTVHQAVERGPGSAHPAPHDRKADLDASAAIDGLFELAVCP